MFPAQVTFKQSSAFLKVLFLFLFLVTCYMLLVPRAEASWTYDKDVPVVTVSATCGDGSSISNNGSCSTTTATVYITCNDYPNPGGSGCKTLSWTATYGSGSQNFSAGTMTGQASISTSSASGVNFTVSAGTATDWAGNSSNSFSSFTFTFYSCSIGMSPPGTPTAAQIPSGTYTYATGAESAEGVGGTVIATLKESVPGSTVVTFASGDTNLLTVDSVTGTYTLAISYVMRGDTTLTAIGTILGVERCRSIIPVHILAVGPWWQLTDADIYANGNLVSSVPASCIGACSNYIDIDGPGGYPGIPNYNSVTPPVWTPTGVVSTKGWITNSAYTGRTFDYDWFLNQTGVPTDSIINDPISILINNTASPAELTTGYLYQGALYRYRNGDLAINEDINIGSNKVVLFVSGNLTINAKINLTAGQGFFAAIVHGNTTVAGTVTNGANAALEGLYLSNGVFDTGASTSRLVVRGSIAGLGGVTLARDLLTPNTKAPAESFIYAPDLIMTMPNAFMRKGIKWTEINP